MASNKLDNQKAEQWKKFRTNTTNNLYEKALNLGLESEPVKALLHKGIVRTFDENFAQAESKEQALETGQAVSLDDLANRSRQGQKEQIIQELVNAGYPMNKDMLQKLSGKELAQVKAQFMG